MEQDLIQGAVSGARVSCRVPAGGRAVARVLHHDADYERIADVTGQPVEWVARNGSL